MTGTHAEKTLVAVLDSALEAVLGVAAGPVITAELKPAGVEASTRSRGRQNGGHGEKFAVGVGRGAVGAVVDGLCDVEQVGRWLGVCKLG